MLIDPLTRWSAARKSPELRIYRSLPSRHQDYREPFEDSKDGTASLQTIYLEESGSDVKNRVDDNSEDFKDASEAIESNVSINERAKRERSANRSEEDTSSLEVARFKRGERSAKSRTDEHEESSVQEPSTPRVSLIKPPRILAKFISPETRPAKHGERKSNIPIFRRSSKEFEDIRSPQESPKRSLIPQRYKILLDWPDNHSAELL